MLNLASLKNGDPVRYRTSTGDNPQGTAPDWSEWKLGTLYLQRRTEPLPKRLKRPGVKAHEAGAIITLTIQDGNTAEFSEDDYSPEFNEWTNENHRLEFHPV